MKTIKAIKTPLLLLCGFIIGYSIASALIKMPALEGVRSEATTKATRQVRIEFAEKEKTYQQTIDSLQARETGLNSKLTTIKEQMAAAGYKYQRLQQQVQALINKYTRSPANPPVTVLPATDSLQDGFTALVNSQIVKDSLCKEAITNLEQQVDNRDTVITSQESRYIAIKGILEKSLQQQDILYQQNTQYRKQIKKQKLRNTLKSVGAIILSALTASYLLTH